MKKTKDGKPMDMILFPKDATPEEMMDMLEEAGFIPKNWREREKNGPTSVEELDEDVENARKYSREPKKQKGATRPRSQ